MSKFMCIDPSAKFFAYTIFDEESIIEYGKIPVSSKNMDFDENYFGSIIRQNNIDAVFIEGQFIDNNNDLDVANVQTMYLIGALYQYCKFQNIQSLIIKPYKWQSNVFFGNSITGNSHKEAYSGKQFTRSDLKYLSRKTASEAINIRINDNDIADSICFALYVQNVVLKSFVIRKQPIRKQVACA